MTASVFNSAETYVNVIDDWISVNLSPNNMITDQEQPYLQRSIFETASIGVNFHFVK
jgi:hypothetical protein